LDATNVLCIVVSNNVETYVTVVYETVEQAQKYVSDVF